jgi:hypothetical protein
MSHNFKAGDYVEVDWYGRTIAGIIDRIIEHPMDNDTIVIRFKPGDWFVAVSDHTVKPLTVLDRLAHET